MDFTERVPFGRTGLMVGRIGLASGYGVPAAAIEKAFYEYGINYLYVSPLLNLGNMVQAIRNLAPSHRDKLCIVLARPYLGGFGGLRLESFVERWLIRSSSSSGPICCCRTYASPLARSSPTGYSGSGTAARCASWGCQATSDPSSARSPAER